MRRTREVNAAWDRLRDAAVTYASALSLPIGRNETVADRVRHLAAAKKRLRRWAVRFAAALKGEGAK